MIPPRSPLAGTSRRGVLLGAGSLLAGTALAACGKEEKPPAVPEGPELASPTPDLGSDQFSRIVTAIDKSLTAADEKKDAKLLAPRVIGSAAEFREATYTIMKKEPKLADQIEGQLGGPDSKVVLPIASVGEKFPRTAIALLGNRTGEKAANFVVLQQKDAQSPYTTWGWATQLAGVDLPKVAGAGSGTETIGADADDLVMTPKDALELYAKKLASGKDADPKKKIAEDPYLEAMHQGIAEERKMLNKGVKKDEVATVHEKYAVQKGEFAALRTADGGALVIASLRSKRSVKIKDGASIKGLQAGGGKELLTAAVTGKSEFGQEWVRDYGTMIALTVPPKDAKAPVQVVGAFRAFLGATGK